MSYTMTEEHKRAIALGRARARKFSKAAKQDERPKRKYTRRVKPEVPPIVAAFAEPAVAPDMKRIERSPGTKLARLRSLDAQATSLLQNFIALRRQITQLAQEVQA